MDERQQMTAVERLKAEADKLGVKVEIVEPTPGGGTVTFLAKRSGGDLKSVVLDGEEVVFWPQMTRPDQEGGPDLSRLGARWRRRS